MGSVLRLAVAIPLGIFTGLLVTAIVEQVNHRFWPLPNGFDFVDRVATQAYVDSLPPASLMLVLLGWVAAVVASLGAAILIARESHRTLAYVMGATFTAVAAQTFALVTHPLWFVLLSMAVLLATTGCAGLVVGRYSRPEQASIQHL